jgi:hypothetical protein
VPSLEDAPDSRSRPGPLSILRRRAGGLLLVAGALLALRPFAAVLPRDHEIELPLREHADVARLELVWTPEGVEEAAQGSALRFAPGSAPRRPRVVVRLPDGRYDVEITIESVDGTRRVLHRAVTLGEADRITLPIP